MGEWLLTGPPWWLVIATASVVVGGVAFLRWVLP